MNCRAADPGDILVVKGSPPGMPPRVCQLPRVHANAHYVFGSLNSWGWITLIIGVLQLLAAARVLAGNQLAR